jgi:hypothetical protein
VTQKAATATVLKKRTASQIPTETASLDATFDVFLSHSSAESENILLLVLRQTSAIRWQIELMKVGSGSVHAAPLKVRF